MGQAVDSLSTIPEIRDAERDLAEVKRNTGDLDDDQILQPCTEWAESLTEWSAELICRVVEQSERW